MLRRPCDVCDGTGEVPDPGVPEHIDPDDTIPIAFGRGMEEQDDDEVI